MPQIGPVKLGCPICGPKLSIFCMVVSVYGLIFLGFFGLFFYIQSTGLFEDLYFAPAEEDKADKMGGMTLEMIIARYKEQATQCWVAAGLYLLTLVLVFWQNKWNTSSAI